MFQSLDVEIGGGREGSKSSLGIPKRIEGFDIKFLDTLGASAGTGFYNATPILYANTQQRLGMPPRPFSGIHPVIIKNGHSNGGVNDTEKYITIIQDTPQPCYVEIINVNIDATFEDE